MNKILIYLISYIVATALLYLAQSIVFGVDAFQAIAPLPLLFSLVGGLVGPAVIYYA